MKRQLIMQLTRKDFDISYFSGTGAGGQHRNKHQNCVRMRHTASGAVGVGQGSRSRKENEREAFLSLVKSPEFKRWHLEKIHEITQGQTLQEQVKKIMSPENLKIEYRENGKWKEPKND